MTDSIDSWFGTLPRWLQTAAANLLETQRTPDETAIVAAANLCICEEAGTEGTFATVPSGAFDTPTLGIQVRLKGVSAISGVNALDGAAALHFGGADLAVVYGHNGSGKSGFARLTKHAASSRVHSTILPNVFSAPPGKPKATFLLERDGVEHAVNWEQGSGALPHLKHLHVFDTDVAKFYMTEKAEATYEPRRLRFISALVEICDRVKTKLQSMIDAKPSRMPAIPSELANTSHARYLVDLKPNASRESILSRLARSADHADRMRALEHALKAPDLALRVQEIASQVRNIDALRHSLSPLQSALSEDRYKEIERAATDARSARQAAKSVAELTFQSALLPGVGDGPWQSMWQAAMKYSTTVAYPEHPYPHINSSRCVLCQQEISEDAAKRLQNFQVFVKNEVEERAKTAESLYERLLASLPNLPNEGEWLVRFHTLPGSEGVAKNLYGDISDSLVSLRNGDPRPRSLTTSFDAVSNLMHAHRTALEGERVLAEAAQEGAARAALQLEFFELRMLEWCGENIESICEEARRRGEVSTLDRAAKKTNTSALTKKKAELARDELTGGYQKRFQQELSALGAGRLRVLPVESSKAKGQIKFSLSISGAQHMEASPSEVLSEGEARIVALAAFLADVTVSGARTPFLFDDPISSLDVDFEERVVARLFHLAQTRQVLVFTHRLSLCTLLTEAHEDLVRESKDKGVPSNVQFERIRLTRLGDRIGLASRMNVSETPVQEAAAHLASVRIDAALEHLNGGRAAEYEQAMKAICSDLRIATERAVEDVLLNKVVLRFRRSVTTQNRLPHLAKISASDCAVLDDLMTRLSVFEHSQSSELPPPIPDWKQVRADAERLRDWVLEFKKRKVPTTA